jgi:hypothetical protein
LRYLWEDIEGFASRRNHQIRPLVDREPAGNLR